MIKWVTELPNAKIDSNIYKPFIKNEWFRKHYMWFAYALMFLLVLLVAILGPSKTEIAFSIQLIIILPVFLIHELLHILVSFRIGNIYITHSGLYFWLHSDAEMSKARFWTFMTLPFLVLSVLPIILKLFLSGKIVSYLEYIAWINAIIASSDIINSILILFKPRNAVFYQGYYRC